MNADKTCNLYIVDVDLYKKTLMDIIIAKYIKAPIGILNDINNEAAEIIPKNKIKRKIRKFTDNSAFITLKDHKDNLPHSLKCRLINPAKSSIRIVSKNILDEIIPKIEEKIKLKQWKSTDNVIKWFNKIKNKNRYTFIKFDIEKFYPSISKGLLLKSIEFAKKYAKITNPEIETILHLCKTVLMHNNEVWIKKDAEKDLFDVLIGSYHGAEVCKLIGFFFIKQSKPNFT